MMNRNLSKKKTASKISLNSWRWFPLLLAILSLVPGTSSALEVYTLIKNGCEPETGLIVNTDDDHVYMLNLEGKLAVLQRKDVELVLVYNIHENPIKFLDLDSGLKESLREVHVDDNESTHFIGWPIRFIENLIMFYDIDGKTHLVDLDKIKTFTQPQFTQLTVKEIANYEPVTFGLGGNLPECRAQETDSKKITEPTRMISDQIKVYKFFSVYNTGFALLKRFQKKTVFYAKPFLYEKDTRLGIVYTRQDYLQELHFIMPLYFQWSSGKPYSSQGQYLFGSTAVDLLPSVEPHFVFRSDVKSHFFTGSFVGNMICLSAGSDCIINNRQIFTDFFSRVNDDDHAIFSQFNHLALTGVDYHEYSLSAGFYYPVYGILGNKIFREISSNQSSPILRFQKTTKNLSLKLIYSQTYLKSDPPTENLLQLIQSYELMEFGPKSETSMKLLENLEQFDLKTQFLRIGFNYDITRETNIGFSEVIFQGNYGEHYSGEAYSLDFMHLISSLSLKQDFSNYVTVKADINYFLRNYQIKLANKTSDANENKVSFAIFIEFLL
ncbi:hypothetical protein WDW89_18265 [Deltaproteobacteria bacterium TL4]